MGVPAFFRWLSKKYPSIVAHCVEEKEKNVGGVSIPVDSSLENPNGVEFDNLYLDMNGIIHPCCHPENKPAPKNEDEMMVAIFEYIDRLIRIVRPRRLLYMAIDGVAPRAKMNQQRSRRFRASKETSDKIDEIALVRQRLLDSGACIPPTKEKGEHFDSNCITPGTPFMDRLAKCLHYYIHERLNSDPGWKNIEVILSDANCPGEGEHKIMDFIRRQRANPNHDPNTRHCLCGADADLIMLGLATHEPYFTIIREEFKPNQNRPCELCGQAGHEVKDCMGLPKEMVGQHDELPLALASDVEFIFLRLDVLREYLERELDMTNLPFPYDVERAIDDWVFMCFFVGNDFLPHLPSLEIREGAIDRLINLYKRTVHRTGGYLTESGMVNMHRVQMIVTELGEMEDDIFKRRQQNEISFRQRTKERKKRMRMSERPAWTPHGQFAPVPITNTPLPVQNARDEAYKMRLQGMSPLDKRQSNINAANDLRSSLRGGQQSNSDGSLKRKRDNSDSEEEPHDEVRLWEAGWRDRYYASKFEVSAQDIQFRYKVAAAYAEGLCWVLQYYYQGCPSWKWFFPYHYAPFASDFINIGDIPTRFEKGTKPFNPMEQLMGVFPAASRQHLPESWGQLMTDSESPIIDFYPTDFKVDLNGKKFAWQGVALLPFVDERRLLKALESVYPLLSEEERRRNERGDDRLYIGQRHSGYKYLIPFYEGNRDYDVEYPMDAELFYGMGGTILLAKDAIEPGGVVASPVPGCEDVHENGVICVRFRDPKYDDNYVFQAKRLPGAKEPTRVLKPLGMGSDNNNWRPMIGMTHLNQRASLGNAGSRMLNFAVHQAGPYSSVPPPMSLMPSSGSNYRQGPQRHDNQGGYNRGSSYRGGGGRGGSANPAGSYHSAYSSNNQSWEYGRGGGGYSRGPPQQPQQQAGWDQPRHPQYQRLSRGGRGASNEDHHQRHHPYQRGQQHNRSMNQHR